MPSKPDAIDDLLRAWKRVRPELDPSPLALVGRALRLAQLLEARVVAALAPLGLSLGQFDILATLRRATDGAGLTPKQLLASVVLTSGGMTGRLDNLEQAGLVVRRPDPADRRGVIVALTAKGKRKIDAATTARFADAKGSLPSLSARDRSRLETMLKTWLADLELVDKAGRE